MEPPAKRQKKHRDLADTEEDDDELTLAPEDLNQRRDPAFQLEQGRTLAANKLKFRLEEVIAKYSRDFTGIGDEIDLATGEVVVDNGHMRSMRSEKDTGDGVDVDEDSEEEEERILRSIKAADRAPASEPARSMISWPARPAMGASPRLTSLFSNQSPFMTPSRSFSPLGYGNSMSMSVDAVWQAPELPESAFANRFGVDGQRLGLSSTTRAPVKKSFPPPVSPDSDGEDALLGMSGNVLKNANKESPLIKQKFPAIDSSPNEDAVHKRVVDDLIGNLPSTPPSIHRSKTTRPRGRPSKLKETHAAGSDTEPKEKPRSRQRKGARHDEASPTANGKILQANQAENPSWDEGDLNDFRDVTEKDVKSAGQILFVDIRTIKSQSSRPSAMEGDGNRASEAIPNTNKQSPAHDGESMAVDAPCDQAATERRNVEKSAASSQKRQPEENFERNVVDPTFAFSDGETMLPKRRGRGKPRLEQAKIVAADPPQKDLSTKTDRSSPPKEAQCAPVDKRTRSDEVQQSDLNVASSQEPQKAGESQVAETALEKNDIDASFAFSDDEVLLPKRPIRGARKPELAAPAGGLPDQGFSAIRESSVNPLVASQAAMNAAEVALERRPRRRSSKTVVVSEERTHGETPVPSTGNEQPVEDESQEVLRAVDAAESQPSHGQEVQEPVAGPPISEALPSMVQQSLRAVLEEESPLVAAPSSSSRESAEVASGQPLLQSKPTTEVGSARSASLKPRLRRSSRRQLSSELGEPCPRHPPAPADAAPEQPDPDKPSSTTTTAAPQLLPATPRRRPKGAPKTPSTSAIELISLLSDDDDDEDEISFDLADFTPSGHHRILVHRPFLPRLLATTPSSYSSARAAAAASTTKKHSSRNRKKRASLFGPFAAPRTPKSAGRSTGSRGEKKGGGLARSVARARRPRRHSSGGVGGGHVDEGVASPAVSVVQTPGGTRRRCGADGFRCDRDFCFVCL